MNSLISENRRRQGRIAVWLLLLPCLPLQAQDLAYPPPSQSRVETKSYRPSVLPYAFSPLAMAPAAEPIAVALAAGEQQPVAGEPETYPSPEASQAIATRAAFLKTAAHAEALALIEARQAEMAYQLLAPLESEYSGDTQFDYLFGLAALESGRSGEAVFSLQRAVAADAGFAGARLELARAHFAAGDNEEAKKEFLALQKLQPPPEAQQAIQRYLAAIEERAAAYEPRLSGAVQLETGYDSNANSGTGIDNFGSVTLSDQSRKQGSAYYGVGLVGNYSRPLQPRLRWRSSLRLGHREVPQAEFVSSTGLLASSELGYSLGRQQLSAGLSLGAQLLQGEFNQGLVALGLGDTLTLSESSRLAASLRLGLLRYGEQIDNAEVMQAIASLAWQWRSASTRSLQFDLGPVFGREDSDDQKSFARALYGLQGSAQSLIAGYPVHAAAGVLQSDYEPLGGLIGDREDTQLSLRFGMELPGLLGGWVINPELGIVRNVSNVGLYDFSRVEAGFSLIRGIP